MSAIELLHRVTRHEAFEIPKKAVIIGGGNVSMDIARSLARFQKETLGVFDITLTRWSGFCPCGRFTTGPGGTSV